MMLKLGSTGEFAVFDQKHSLTQTLSPERGLGERVSICIDAVLPAADFVRKPR